MTKTMTDDTITEATKTPTVMATITKADKAKVDIGCGEVDIDDLIRGLEHLKEYAEMKIKEAIGNDEFHKALVSSMEDIAKSTATRIVRRNSVKRDIAASMIDQIIGNEHYMDQIAQAIIRVQNMQTPTETP
jgi:hypothetical protein